MLPVFSRSPKPSGVRPPSITFLVSALSIRWTGRAPNFNNAIKDMRTKLGANAWPVLIPIGKEDYLKGQLDVINKKAIIYSDSDASVRYEVEADPGGA